MIEVSRLKDLNAAKLFLGFRIRPSVVATLPFFQYRVNASPEEAANYRFK
jgi:hypothetical protein